MRKLTLGFLINPYAGVGGPIAEKGSDAKIVIQRAANGELALRALSRAAVFLQAISAQQKSLNIITVQGAMGAQACVGERIDFTVINYRAKDPSTSLDTQAAAQALVEHGIDCLVFVGGDGTARDVYSAIGAEPLVLGVPSGVKMHSGVFGITPLASAEIIKLMVSGQYVGVSDSEVCDIDENAFRNGVVKRKIFGYMRTPALPEYVQHVKQGGMEVEELVLLDIAAEIRERIDDIGPNCLVICGPGSTTQFIQTELGCTGTLLGVDVVCDGELVALDVNAQQLERLVDEHRNKTNGHVRLLLTMIGGQGHIVGRGNQQLSPAVLRAVSRENIWLVSTLTKLASLNARPLQIDSNDSVLDNEWAGMMPVITGYREERLYPLGLIMVEPVNSPH